MSHGDGGFGAEVLHDHFLDVAVALVQVTDREHRINAVFRRLADADQQSCGEGNLLLSSLFNRAQALGREFVGSIVVSGALRKQAVRWSFQALGPCWARRRPGGQSIPR